MITVEKKMEFGKGRRRNLRERPAPGRVPRVARLMALAIRFDQMIRDGIVADQAELARLGRVTRARLTQIMSLLSLAPDIQQEILELKAPQSGRDPVTERRLRSIATEMNWTSQRQSWHKRTP